MTRLLRYSCLGLVALTFLGVAAVHYRLPAPRPVPDPKALIPADLVRGVVRGSLADGLRVSVTGRYRLTPTDSPLVFDYVPGVDCPATVRFQFRDSPPPHLLAVGVWTASGTVSGIVPDNRARVSGVRGVVLLTDCSVP